MYAITFSPDGKFLATGSGDGWLHIYHVRVCPTIFLVRESVLTLSVDVWSNMVMVRWEG